MPTYGTTDRFRRDFATLTLPQKKAFKDAVRKFIKDLPSKKFRAGLRIKRVQGTTGIFEMTWADDGRATFEYGPVVREGEAHVIWRRVGTHSIFDKP